MSTHGIRLVATVSPPSEPGALDTLVGLVADQARIIVMHAASVEAEHSPETLQALSIAIRRLRTLLWVCRPLLPNGMARRWGDRLASVASLASSARYWDVLIDELLPDMTEATQGSRTLIGQLTSVALERRDRARHDAAQLLRDADLPALLGQCLQDLYAAAARPDKQSQLTRLAPFAQRTVKRATQVVRRRARQARQGDMVKLRRARMAIKKLRYVIEFFAPVLGKRDRRRLVKLARWQHRLSRLDDMNAARNRLPRVFVSDTALRDAALHDAVLTLDAWLRRGIDARQKVAAKKLAEYVRRSLRAGE